MIEIINADLITNEDGQFWAVWLFITQEEESWMLPTTAPGTLENGDLQTYFEARKAELWRVAQAKRYTPDVLKRVPSRRLLKSVVLVIVDELNVLREEQGMPELTEAEMIAAVKAKLR